MATCYRHPNRETGVSCSNCGRPICPDCMTPTPVGMRCPECSRDRTQVRTMANIHGDPVPRAPDTWLEIEGHWQQRTGDHADQPPSDTAILLAESVRTIKQPSEPYERGLPF